MFDEVIFLGEWEIGLSNLEVVQLTKIYDLKKIDEEDLTQAIDDLFDEYRRTVIRKEKLRRPTAKLSYEDEVVMKDKFHKEIRFAIAKKAAAWERDNVMQIRVDNRLVVGFIIFIFVLQVLDLIKLFF